jgi:alpha-beta hydrolase superfamily lysophospholipase
MNRKLKKILIVVASLYVAVFFGLYFLQEKIIFLPETLPQDYTYSFQNNFRELFLNAEDGAKLNALHFKVENPKGVILYFHGNAGDLSRWGIVVQKFVALQYDVLVMDYRTYGKSTGKLSEKALNSDAQLFYNYLLINYPEDKIVVYGRSLGTTFATYVASENNPKQLFLEAPFYSLTELASSSFPIYPVGWFLKYNFPTNMYLEEVKCPIIIFHGTDDFVVNFENSQKLSKINTKGELRLVTIPGGAHNNLADSALYNEILFKTL